MEAGSRTGNSVVDAAGPDTFSFKELLRLLASAVNAHSLLVPTLPPLVCAFTGLVGLPKRDVVLTRDEVTGLLTSEEPPAGTMRLSD